MKSTNNKNLFSKEDLNKWYLEVIKKSEVFLHDDIKGFFYFDWYGLKIWERIKIILSDIFEENQIREIKTPLFFQKSELEQEKNHFSGFSPEVFELSYKNHQLILRPTSEILFLKYFKKKLFSYKDLPFIAGQWGNVFRKEKNNKAFLRNNEFFWYEGHGVFENQTEVQKNIAFLNNLFYSFFNDILFLPFIFGNKTENEKFFGALETFTFEVLLPDNQWLQATTVHNLGTNFSKNFSFKLPDKSNQFFYPWTNSFGISTRIIGGLIMSHGDENGLVLPSEIAVFQVCFVIYWKFLDEKKIKSFLDEWKYKLKHIFHLRFIFNSQKVDPFWFLKDCIIKGVCLFVEIGRKEFEEKFFTFFTRTNFKKEKINISNANKNFFWTNLSLLNASIKAKQDNFLKKNLKEPSSIDEFNNFLKDKTSFFIYVNLKSLKDHHVFEKKINSFDLSIRAISSMNVEKKCFFSQEKATHIIYIGRAY
ncbi:proline--tRNA ligase [symbiont of Argiope bruennichi]|uniref:aminoacyl--tRNA ligase-related protein n=1 Tax=symbiont of Argiope bruennichi TaxID=2810479 RepID=UPI003DA310FD